MLRSLLMHPLTRGFGVDDPRTTLLRKRIVREKPFLRKIYSDWYAEIIGHLPAGEGQVLELGSGPGFLAEWIPDLITSEVFCCSGTKVALDAQRLPIPSAALRAIVMTDVLHHIPSPEAFFREAERVLIPGGRIVMIEPWVSTWSKFVYTRFHSEPFRPQAQGWGFPSSGPLSGANGAMPWLIFFRDRKRFDETFPGLSVRLIRPMMPFRYLASGGVSMRSLMPGWSYGFWAGLEYLLTPAMRHLAMFALIVVEHAH